MPARTAGFIRYKRLGWLWWRQGCGLGWLGVHTEFYYSIAKVLIIRGLVFLNGIEKQNLLLYRQ